MRYILPGTPRMTDAFVFKFRFVVSVLALTIVKVIVAQTMCDTTRIGGTNVTVGTGILTNTIHPLLGVRTGGSRILATSVDPHLGVWTRWFDRSWNWLGDWLRNWCSDGCWNWIWFCWWRDWFCDRCWYGFSRLWFGWCCGWWLSIA